MPAIRAAASTSPLVMALLATFVVVSGSMETRQRARARRCVGSRGVTSTMRAPPSGSRLASMRSDTGLESTTWHDSRPTPNDPRARYTWQSQVVSANERPTEEPMPTYEYACTACGHRLEAVQSFTDEPLTECPECHGALRKVYGAVGIVLKGSGFYKNDSRAASTGNGSGKKSLESTSSDTAGGDSSSKDSSTKK